MDDARLARVGKAFTQIAELLTAETPAEERVITLAVLIGQLSAEYQASETEAREEGRQTAHDAGWATGYLKGAEDGRKSGRQDALEAMERAITGEPVTMEQADAAESASEPQHGAGEAAPKGSVH